MKRRHARAVACAVALLYSGILTACSEDETYTDNPTVDAVKVAEHARWAQTFDGGTVAYLTTSQGMDSALCVARLSDGRSHNVVDVNSIRCLDIQPPR